MQALTKVIALMPPRLRRRIDALRTQTDGVPWGGGPIDRRRPAHHPRPGLPRRRAAHVRLHRPRRRSRTDRRVEPHRLVSLGRRWYLVAYDRDRQDWRSFRLDRITGPAAPASGSGRASCPVRTRRPSCRPASARSAAPRRTAPGRGARADVEARLGRWARSAGRRRRVPVASPPTPSTGRWWRSPNRRDFTVESPPELVDLVASDRGPVRVLRVR